MGGKIRKHLKIAVYTLLTLSLLISISFILVVSHPFFLNTYVSSVAKYSGASPDVFEFHIYSKETFSAEHFNTSLTSGEDFIFLFESRYVTRNKYDLAFTVVYQVNDSEDRSAHTNYWISKYTDLVFASTWKGHRIDEKEEHRIDEDTSEFIIEKDIKCC